MSTENGLPRVVWVGLQTVSTVDSWLRMAWMRMSSESPLSLGVRTNIWTSGRKDNQVQDRTLDKCRDLLALTHLRRWNVVPLTREQSVAEHSHRVAVISMAIVERFNQLDESGNYSGLFDLGRILRWALVHDGPECLTGDLPSGVKRLLGAGPIQDMEDQLCPWFSDEEAQINIHDELIVKVADLIEANSWLALHGTIGAQQIRLELIDRISELQMQGVSMLGNGFHKATHEVWEQAISGQIPSYTPWRKREAASVRGNE